MSTAGSDHLMLGAVRWLTRRLLDRGTDRGQIGLVAQDGVQWALVAQQLAEQCEVGLLVVHRRCGFRRLRKAVNEAAGVSARPLLYVVDAENLGRAGMICLAQICELDKLRAVAFGAKRLLAITDDAPPATPGGTGWLRSRCTPRWDLHEESLRSWLVELRMRDGLAGRSWNDSAGDFDGRLNGR